MLKGIDVNESEKLSARIEISLYFRFHLESKLKWFISVARSYFVVVPMIILNAALLSVSGCQPARLVSAPTEP